MSLTERPEAINAFKQRWQDGGGNSYLSEAQNLLLPVIACVLDEVQDGTLLEIACGSGLIGNNIANQKSACKVIGFDITKEAIALSMANKTGHSSEFFQADAFQIPLASDSITASWSEGMLANFPRSWQNILDEQYRIIKPGGLLITSVPNILNLPRTFALKKQGEKFRYYPGDGFLPGPLGALYKKYNALGLHIARQIGWGITYPAKTMYEWDEKQTQKRYPLYTKFFHVLGNHMDYPIREIDTIFKGHLSKWIGFQYVLVGIKQSP